MYKNLIINKEYIETSNEIIEKIPYFFNKSTHYKIDQLKIKFRNNIDIIKLSQNNDVSVDILNGKINHTETPKLQICYLCSNQDNNAVIYGLPSEFPTEYHLNLITSGFFMNPDGEIMMDSDWFELKDYIYFMCYNQDFEKIAIQEIYLNIKFKYENPDIFELQK
jgi:hypothetical protein